MTDKLSRAYEAEKLKHEAAMADYLEAHRVFVALHEKVQQILKEKLTSKNIRVFLSAAFERSQAKAALQEKSQRVDEVSREAGVLLQELNWPPKGE
jgi:PleD family two-component response regulator